MPNYAAVGYVGIMTTGGTPAAIVAKLNAAINVVIREDEFARHFSALGYEMTAGSVEDFARFLDGDIARYAALMKSLGSLSSERRRGATHAVQSRQRPTVSTAHGDTTPQ